MTQPVLVLPLFQPNVEVDFRGWIGSALYIRNLARVLSQLPTDERPRILILTDGGLDAHLLHLLPPGYAEALAGTILPAWPHLAPGPDPALEAGAAAKRRLRAAASARMLMAIMADMKATFP